MRVRKNRDVTFNNCTEFGVTEVFVDCIGPLIDVSKIKEFRDVEDVRYLKEEEIAHEMTILKQKSYRSDEILRITREALSHSKLAVRLVDVKMLMQICRAKKFCSVKIVSTVPDNDLFDLAKHTLIEYSRQILQFDLSSKESELYKELVDSDFVHISATSTEAPGILLCQTGESNTYKIAIDDNSLAFNATRITDKPIPSFQEWIGGIRDSDHAERLKTVLDKRHHIYNATCAVDHICSNNKIELPQYTIMDDYFVYSNDLRDKLNKRIEAIRHVLDDGRAKAKPICVFLAGAPGTGKSYFVECFAKFVECDKQYPVSSLSGVPRQNFYDAIEHHVEQVYNTKKGEKQIASVAFLDEIDTKGDYFAFRFLMDAMTGSRTNDKGISMKNFKSGTVENLVWFFAGSAGATRQEFMSQLKDDERKVIDFFDRIHFDIQLPSVNEPGQAVLTMLSSIKSYWKQDQLPKRISKKVLLAFACTKWTSTRSILTICRIAAAHPNAQNSDEIRLEFFEGIDTSEEFLKQYNFIKEHVNDTSTVSIIWKEGE